MKILISGSHGLLGSVLIPFLKNAGHQVQPLIRKRGQGVAWNPDAGYIERFALEGFDAVIHLAAENIGSGIWTKKKKEKIQSSRIKGTKLLAETISSLSKPPNVLISASAIGYYGDRGTEQLAESSSAGNSFLARVCQEWESATLPATNAGIRVVHLRSGLILSLKGGILPRFILATKMVMGACLGSGKQYQPWIAIDDVLKAIEYILIHPELTGPVNLVAPQFVTNYEFTHILGHVLKRPILFSIPAFILKTILGDMARELLLSSALVQPKKLYTSGFRFQYPQVEAALESILAKKEFSGT